VYIRNRFLVYINARTHRGAYLCMYIQHVTQPKIVSAGFHPTELSHTRGRVTCVHCACIEIFPSKHIPMLAPQYSFQLLSVASTYFDTSNFRCDHENCNLVKNCCIIYLAALRIHKSSSSQVFTLVHTPLLAPNLTHGDLTCTKPVTE